MKHLSNNDCFRSSDLALCASLTCYGYTVEAIDKTNKSKVEFIIKRDEKLDQVVQKYWTHKLVVEPATFFNIIRELKSRIYQ